MAHFLEDHALELVAGVAMLALMGWLVYLQPRNRATLAFAALLLATAANYLRGGLVDTHADATAPLVLETAPEQLVVLKVVQLLNWATGLATLYFLLVFPRPRGWIGRASWSWVPFLVVYAVVAVLVFTSFGLFYDVSLVDGEVEIGAAGPLSLGYNIWTLSLGFAALALAHEANKAPPGPYRRSLLVVFVAFAFYATQWGISLVGNDLGRRLSGDVWAPGHGRISYLLDELAGVVGAIGVLMVAWRRDRYADDDGASRKALVAIGVASLVPLGVLVFGAPPPPGAVVSKAQDNIDNAGALLLPLLVAYALVRHRLFDIDVRLRWTISRGALAAIFLGVFFVAAELAQNFLSDEYGWAMGGVAAGVLLFAISPIQRVAERVANAAVPAGERSVDEKKREVYRLALSVALADRVVTREEERHLARLAEELGLAHTEALLAREEVEREMGLLPDAPPPSA